jgi:hypothetical protein
MWSPQKHELFGFNAFSLKTTYLTCIGEQLRNALNDLGRPGKIYQGLTNHILTKHGGAELLSTLNKESYKNSPTTRTIYLFKHIGLTHIKSFQENYHIGQSPLAEIRLKKANRYQRLSIELS